MAATMPARPIRGRPITARRPPRHVRPYPQAYPQAYPAYPATTVLPNGAVVTSTQAGGGYYAGGYYWPGATITTVTVQSGGSDAVYEEVYEDATVYRGKGRRYTKGGCRC